MKLPESKEINIAGLSRIFDNKSESYKLFWFKALLSHVERGENETSFESLIDEMISDAWYMVSEYHLNLGPSDNLERAVDHIAAVSGLLHVSRKEDVLKWLRNTNDVLVIEYKNKLKMNVPYRLQAPLLGFGSKEWEGGLKELGDRINRKPELIYYFNDYHGLDTTLYVTPEWMDYLQTNKEILRGWLEYNMVVYLQRRNPSVPGISDKLYPPQERNLTKIKKYWNLLSGLEEFHDIYGGFEVVPKKISIDHFVPWSYVAHDELWNLHPTTRSINSSKSNNLPDWDKYFSPLGDIEYHAYQMMWKYDKVHDVFDECAREHLNNHEVATKLYRQGLEKEEFKEQLESVLHPIYQSAQSCGFRSWVYSNE